MPTARSNPNWGDPPWQIDFAPPPATVPASVDVAIIGAGFTGLAAAAWLRHLAPEKSVAVFEAWRIGAGASGRTGGMALAESAAGDIRGLGDPLAGLKHILGELGVECELALPGVWEIAREKGIPHSPIDWNDSGRLRVVNEVPGGTLDPGKLVAGLARAASERGAEIFENHPVTNIEWPDAAAKDRSNDQCAKGIAQEQAAKRTAASQAADQAADGRDENSRAVIELGGSLRASSRAAHCTASKILFATNALSLDLAALEGRAEPKLTLAIATEPLTKTQLEAIGLAAGNPFYTVDLPYLWGRVRQDRSVIFGAGLVDAPSSDVPRDVARDESRGAMKNVSKNDLSRVDIAAAKPQELFASIERRIRNLHPALPHVGFTHRWGGPILFQQNWRPVFAPHPRSKNAIVLGAYAGHGVALSSYLGAWAAEALLGRREHPSWGAMPDKA
ncbi:MAG: NAD(P)/FAD-dependent oxidoreductase [Candidatus Acidiferrales bacterium]